MNSNSVAGFFGGGGGKGAKFPTVGTTVTGTITAVHPPENQTEFGTGRVLENKFQVRIDLATSERDIQDQYDDGARTLYVRGWMTGAIGDAVRKSGAREPEIGGTLTVKYSGDGQPSRPGISGPKQYEATYVAPATTGSFFNGDQQANQPNPALAAATIDAPPPGVDAAAWAAMPADAKAAVKASLAGAAPAPF